MHIVKARREDSTASHGGAPPRKVTSFGSDQLVEGDQPVGEESTDSFFESECPTRKVLNPLAAQLNQPNASSAALPKASSVPSTSLGRWKGSLFVTIAIAVTAATGVAIWQAVRTPKILPLSLQSAVTNRPAAPPIVPAPLWATAPRIHVEIGVQPAMATLELDDKATGGNQLRFDTLRDGQIHTVHASAPGFASFNKVVSFSTDVYLSIELQRVRDPKPDVGKDRGLRPERKPGLNSRVRPVLGLTDDLEMTRPSPRHRNSVIDEKDPYEP
jgi:hypothetical protein